MSTMTREEIASAADKVAGMLEHPHQVVWRLFSHFLRALPVTDEDAPVEGDEACHPVRAAALDALRACDVDDEIFAAVAAATYDAVKAIVAKAPK